MLQNLRKFALKSYCSPVFMQKLTFLTNDYKCTDSWNSQISSPILDRVNLNNFYNLIEQKYSSKGVISAIDVDIFANAVKEPIYLEELKDLLQKLRLSAETDKTLDSTHHATVRNYIEFGDDQDLINILKDPLRFGVFLDDYTANIFLNKLIKSERYEQAADIAALVMLQEDYSNEITTSLSQYACYKYVESYQPPIPTKPLEEIKQKVEEIKVRVKFLRNPYYDDHFDIKDTYTLAGKTLAWMAQRSNDNVSYNLQMIGWLVYKKYDNLLSLCGDVATLPSSKVFVEVIELLKKELVNEEEQTKTIIEKCLNILETMGLADVTLEDSIKIAIENAINKYQNKDILAQKQLYKSWVEIREDRLEEQTKRLDRAKRIQVVQEKQRQMREEEQRLWFFENEEKIDLEIEEKESLVDSSPGKKTELSKIDENYIPPEILPKRK